MFQPGVFTTGDLTSRGFYIQQFLQAGVLQAGVLTSSGLTKNLTSTVSYNQGS